MTGDDLRLVLVEARGPLAVAAASGEMDLYTVTAFHRRAAALIDDHPRLILDLSGITFCDSSGLNTLLRLRRHAGERGGRLVLSAPADQVMRMLRLTGADTVFPLYADVAEARAAQPPGVR
ncbi:MULTISPECIES: STAS domain-containing protein [Streptomyces]|uniref:Anti-sigma factor antagonist n=1 Tax=Streptomyces sudanensis TaxID=436397 RepID=A0ABY4THY5_9ACTN|nr:MULTISPECIES: STAS domain-containing protein [Streptomyces]MCP9960163.1 STAS domain-containing protein [Streptomyces sudanensis]MCP9989161.1 STAS domain-containing protein [Streptomyces sudanensis]MCP9999467.1 STAS domain-containing protein [Streptomyces sudanensis]URN18486.1 STAS domain-containing protein [Streptomyces sudanensis]